MDKKFIITGFYILDEYDDNFRVSANYHLKGKRENQELIFNSKGNFLKDFIINLAKLERLNYLEVQKALTIGVFKNNEVKIKEMIKYEK